MSAMLRDSVSDFCFPSRGIETYRRTLLGCLDACSIIQAHPQPCQELVEPSHRVPAQSDLLKRPREAYPPLAELGLLCLCCSTPAL